MAITLFELAYVAAYFTFVVGILSFIARFYSHRMVLKSWSWDGTVSCVVLVISIIHQVVLQLFLDLSCGKPQNQTCSFQSPDLLRTLFIGEIVMYAAHCAIKMDFLLFYLRLSSGQLFRVFVYLGLALNFAIFLSSLLMSVLQCVPFEKILNPTLYPEAKCIDARTIMLTPPVLNIAMNFYIICIPIITIRTLQMTFRRKVSILSVLTFGLVSITVAILRLPVLISITSMKTDASVDVGEMIIIAAFEVQCAIIAVNLSAMKTPWTKPRERQSPAGSKDNSPQRSYKLSSVNRRNPGDLKKNSSMDSNTRLERGPNSSELVERLVRQTARQGHLKLEGKPRTQPLEDGGARDMGFGQKAIIVTTKVDVQFSPVTAQNSLPPKHGLGYLNSR